MNLEADLGRLTILSYQPKWKGTAQQQTHLKEEDDVVISAPCGFP